MLSHSTHLVIALEVKLLLGGCRRAVGSDLAGTTDRVPEEDVTVLPA